jgi:ribonucleoside-triphosphate reductase
VIEQKTEVYSRVVGYIRPVEQWNKGKQAEFSDRKEYINGNCGTVPAKKVAIKAGKKSKDE